MGIAAMVIGIIAVIVGFVPGCGYFALIPAIVGLVLGSVDMAARGKQQLPRGMAIAGVVLNIIAIIFILLWTLLFVTTATPVMVEEINESVQTLPQPAAEAPAETAPAAPAVPAETAPAAPAQ